MIILWSGHITQRQEVAGESFGTGGHSKE